MSDTYPVVLYPRQILKFMAQNERKAAKPKQSSPKTYSAKSAGSRKLSWKWMLGSIAFFAGLVCSVKLVSLLYAPWLVWFAWGLIWLGFLPVVSALKVAEVRRRGDGEIGRRGDGESPSVTQSPSPLSPHTLLTPTLQPSKNSSAAQVGVSEGEFLRYLSQYFSGIKQGIDFDSGADYPYSADFVLVHRSGLSIDIEIDEPYVGNTKQPHHAIDQGKDSQRNAFFIRSNWVVIRFAEEQVVRYPRSCCKTIAQAIYYVTGDSSYLEKLRVVPDPIRVPLWTSRQAKRMAKQNYRQTYLSRIWNKTTANV